MKAHQFATPQEAEDAFYKALSDRDLTAMMKVWAEGAEATCIHPSGPRLTGYDVIREAWRQIFASGARLHFQIRDCQAFEGPGLAVHIVDEIIRVHGQAGVGSLTATNVYLLTGQGWKMILHHASPAHEAEREGEATDADDDGEEDDNPRTLH